MGVVYNGLALLGSGSVLAGMVLGAMAAFIIDRKLTHAAVVAFVGAALAFVGLIHGAASGLDGVAAGGAGLRHVRRGVPGHGETGDATRVKEGLG